MSACAFARCFPQALHFAQHAFVQTQVHDAARANTAYRRFARKIERAGLTPPNVLFRQMVSRTSQNVFCILTTTESVFNSACSVGKFYVVESGIDERRRLCAVRVRDHVSPNNPQENVM